MRCGAACRGKGPGEVVRGPRACPRGGLTRQQPLSQALTGRSSLFGSCSRRITVGRVGVSSLHGSLLPLWVRMRVGEKSATLGHKHALVAPPFIVATRI